jgi:hypothetical protein
MGQPPISCKQPKTIDNCLKVLTKAVGRVEHPKSGNKEQDRIDSEIIDSELQVGLFIICQDAHNDPDLALLKLEAMKYSH